MDNIRKKRYENNELSGPMMSIIGVIFLVLAIFLYNAGYQTTKDAHIEGRLIEVSSRVPGSVLHIYVSENQEVKKGDLLLEINPAFYEDQLRLAEVQLKKTRTKLATYGQNEEAVPQDSEQPSDDTQPVDSGYSLTKTDYGKYANVYTAEFFPKQDLKRSREALTSSGINNASINKVGNEKDDEEKEKATPEELAAEIQRLEAVVAEAKLELSYTKIYASQDGIVSAVTAVEGNYVEMAQSLISIIPKSVWVCANFAPKQLAQISVGMPAKIKIGTYPHRTFKGVVDDVISVDDKKRSNISTDDNDGNVRILFTEDYSEFNIAPGTSVSASVKIK